MLILLHGRILVTLLFTYNDLPPPTTLPNSCDVTSLLFTYGVSRAVDLEWVERAFRVSSYYLRKDDRDKYSEI